MTQHEERTVWYEPHPVTAERKAEIRAHGFVILDAVFKPEGYENPDVPELKLDAAPAAPQKLGIAELRAALTEKGIAFPDGAKKAELQALLDAAPAA